MSSGAGGDAMNFFILLPTIAFLLNTVVWSYVFGQRSRESVNTAFLMFSAAAGGWLATDLFMLLPGIHGFASIVYRLQAIFWVPIGFLFLNFAYALVGRKPDTLHRAMLLSSLLCSLLYVFTDFFVIEFRRFDWGFGQVLRPWPHIGLSLVPAFSSFTGLYLVISSWRVTADPIKKKTFMLIFIGGLVTVSATFTLNTLLPSFLGIYTIPQIGSSALALFILIIFYAVTRYRFLSISVEKVAEELFEDIQDGVLLINRDGVIERENQAARRLLDLSAPAVGMREEELFGDHPISKGRQGEFELEMKRSRRILSVSLSTSTRSGTEIGRVVILRDITESKRIEKGLRHSRDDLELEVEKRTAQLRHAQRMEAIGTFAGAIAHDFNNLLAAILGFANAAKNDLPESSAVRHDLDEVLLAGNRAKEIVRQLLTFSRRQDKTDYQVIMIRNVVKETLDLLRVSMPTTIQINHDIDEVDGAVRCDPAQIGQVIMNLATNAFQSMKGSARGRLSVRLEETVVDEAFAEQHPQVRPGNFLRISVRDTGCGMDEKTLARIFDPFFTTKDPGEGTGLGLSTALGIVHSHDGTITVESAANEGTCFHVYLPEVARESQHTQVPDLTAAGGSERVLFVDDEIQLLRMGKRLLEPLGYRISLASDGVEALDLVKAAPGAFDIVVTDQTMPNMTGLELAAEIRRIAPSLPLILISGCGEEFSISESEATNIRAFLKKPVPVEKICDAIRSIMDC